MSFTSRIINDDENNESNTSIATHHGRTEHFALTAYSTSSMVINIRQLQNDFQAQYKHEQQALTELNQRFRLFIDRVQLLESQNTEYAAQIAELRHQFSGVNSIDIQWSERYAHLQSDFTMVNYAQVDYEFAFELSQLQIGIYQQLIGVEEQSKYGRCLKLEQELKQLVSVLVTQRASYAELSQTVESLYVAYKDLSVQYLRLTGDWSSVKKQRKKWDLSVQTLKSHIVCYKRLRSYLERGEFESVSVETIDVKQFWSLELEKCKRKIRRDFEVLYASFYREMTSYYESKMEQIQTDVEQTVQYQQAEIEELAISQQTLQVEYEEVQKSLSYENRIQLEYQATYSKLEAELKSMRLQHKKQMEAQSIERQSVEESITTVAYDVDEIRRSKMNLEVEITVYRHLLDSSEIEEHVVIAPRRVSVANEVAEKFIVESERKRKGSIGIKECAASGRYISLMNHSTTKDIDISRWVLKRRIDSAPDLLYTLPDGVRLQQGKELIIYSKLGAGGATALSSDHSAASSLSHQTLVINDLASWGMGSTIRTSLLDQNGEERASHTQSIVFGRNNI